MRKSAAVVFALLLSVFLTTVASAQEKKEAAAATAPATTTSVASSQSATAPAAVRRPNFAIVFGAITKIDTSDPAKTKLEVKSDVDNTTHTIELTPWTNVTKVTDVSELKTGDTVRIMARKVDANEVAMTIVFGKIRNVYAPRTTTPAASAQPSQPATTPVQK